MLRWLNAIVLTCPVIVLPALLAPQVASGQDAASGDIGVRLGLGPLAPAAAGLDLVLGGTLQLTVSRGHHQGSLRLTALGNASGSSDDEVIDLALLYGRSVASTRAYAALSVGPGFVSVRGCGESGRGICHTAGLTVWAEAALHARVIGISVQAVGGLNSVAPFFGLGVVLWVGWMG